MPCISSDIGDSLLLFTKIYYIYPFIPFSNYIPLRINSTQLLYILRLFSPNIARFFSPSIVGACPGRVYSDSRCGQTYGPSKARALRGFPSRHLFNG